MTQFDPRSMLDEEPAQPSPDPAARARRRRARRTFFPSDAEGQAAMLAELARRAYPSYELYVLALVCGVILGAGFYFDAPSVLIFGALSAPLLTPWVGTTLASLTGSLRFFAQTLAALFVSVLIVFVIGLVAGIATTPSQPVTLNQVYLHSRLWPAEFVVIAVSAILMMVTFVRTETRPYLPSAMLAYEFYLPASAAGFGIGANLADVWPQAGVVFLIHFLWATLFGLIALAFLRFRPLTVRGFLLTFLVVIAIFAGLLGPTGFAGAAMDLLLGKSSPPSQAQPAPTTLVPPSPTALLVSTVTPAPAASATPTPTLSPAPSGTQPPAVAVSPTLLGGDIVFPDTPTNTPTVTIEPTPIYAKINAPEGGGAYMRKTPGGEFLATLDNGVVVEVLGETQEVRGVTWVKIAAIKNGIRMEGWIIQSVLLTATPVVNWEPTGTPTPLP
jgi:hypothetical protein